MYSYVGMKWALGFSFYSCSIMVFFSSLNIVFFLVGFSFFFVLFVGGVSCVFIYLLRSSLVLFILGVLGPRGFSGRPGHIFLLRGAPLCGVSVRYYLFEC